eukprot:6206147-Pleurochrysis_carterae.AAC.2
MVTRSVTCASACVTQVYRVDLSFDKSQVLSCCDSGDAKVWDTCTGEELINLECGAPVSCGAISKDKAL